MPDLERVRFLAEHYRQLQGLKRLPIGLFLILAGPIRLGWVPGQRYVQPTSWPMVEALAVVFAVAWIIQQLYERRYGAVRPRQTEQGVEDFALGILWFMVYLIVAAVDVRHPGWPIYVSMLVFSAPMFYVARTQPSRAPHYVAGGLLIAALSLLPLVAPGRSVVGWAIMDMTIGLAIVVTGLGDHRVWVRSVHELQGGDHGQSV